MLCRIWTKTILGKAEDFTARAGYDGLSGKPHGEFKLGSFLPACIKALIALLCLIPSLAASKKCARYIGFHTCQLNYIDTIRRGIINYLMTVKSRRSVRLRQYLKRHMRG